MLTQTIYGKSKSAAVLLIGQNLTIVIRIKIHKTAMTTRPPAGDRRVKKATFHRTLTTSWAAKKYRAVLAAGFPGTSFQIRKRDMPIRVNRMIQINPMVEPGGVKEGLIRVGYQFATDSAVNAEPMMPAI